jgi:Na+/H+-dicarboxylate symporter
MRVRNTVGNYIQVFCYFRTYFAIGARTFGRKSFGPKYHSDFFRIRSNFVRRKCHSEAGRSEIWQCLGGWSIDRIVSSETYFEIKVIDAVIIWLSTGIELSAIETTKLNLLSSILSQYRRKYLTIGLKQNPLFSVSRKAKIRSLFAKFRFAEIFAFAKVIAKSFVCVNIFVFAKISVLQKFSRKFKFYENFRENFLFMGWLSR